MQCNTINQTITFFSKKALPKKTVCQTENKIFAVLTFFRKDAPESGAHFIRRPEAFNLGNLPIMFEHRPRMVFNKFACSNVNNFAF